MKPKELEWEKEFKIGVENGWFTSMGELNEGYLKVFIKQTLTQQRTELFKDLIKIADSGEFEDMRREVTIYFKGKDED